MILAISPFLPSFYMSFDSHLSFLDNINSALTHLPVSRLLSFHLFHKGQFPFKNHFVILLPKIILHHNFAFFLQVIFLTLMEKNGCFMHAPEFFLPTPYLCQVLLLCCSHLCPGSHHLGFTFLCLTFSNKLHVVAWWHLAAPSLQQIKVKFCLDDICVNVENPCM